MKYWWDESQTHANALTPAELKVSQWLQAHHEQAINLSIKRLAQEVGVSEPTIIRFCRKIGLSGFPALKIQLAQQANATTDFPSTIGYGRQSLSAEDDNSDIARKVLHNSVEDIEWLHQHSMFDEIAVTAAQIASASRIECFGLGGSAIAAQDAMFKLNRLGYQANMTLSLHDYAHSLAQWRANTLLWVFSRTSKDHVPAILHKAINCGINVILVGPQNPQISEEVSQIHTRDDERLGLDTPIKSRVMQLVIIDMVTAILKLKFNTRVD